MGGELVSQFEPARPAVGIIKHANPCRVATGGTLAEAYRKAFACDQTSAFGGIVAANREINSAMVEAIAGYIEAAEEEGAETVTLLATGPVGGTYTVLTGADGTATASTGKVKNPSGEWCFEVTSVTHASLAYDPGANVTTRSCESGDVYREGVARSPALALRNYPNPFNPTTTIEFVLPRETAVSTQVFDAQGRLVATLVDGSLGAGACPSDLTGDGSVDAADLPQGPPSCRTPRRSPPASASAARSPPPRSRPPSPCRPRPRPPSASRLAGSLRSRAASAAMRAGLPSTMMSRPASTSGV